MTPFLYLPYLPLCLYPSLLSSYLLLVLNFSLDSRWGLHADRLALGKGQTYARSVPGLSLLQAADRTLTSCHLTSDLLVADVAVTQGRHYWACSVEPGSYLVKVRGMLFGQLFLELQCAAHSESALPHILTQNGSQLSVIPFLSLTGGSRAGGKATRVVPSPSGHGQSSVTKS